jgi:hypothetical protein
MAGEFEELIETRKLRKSQNPHPLVKQTPKGCGTQNRVIAQSVAHPPKIQDGA